GVQLLEYLFCGHFLSPQYYYTPKSCVCQAFWKKLPSLLPLSTQKEKPPLESDGIKCPYGCPYMGRLRCLVVLLDFLPVERDPGRDAANGKDGCDNDQSDRPTGESVFGIFNIEN